MTPVPETPGARPAPLADGVAGPSDVHVVVGAGGAVGRLVVAHLHAAGGRVPDETLGYVPPPDGPDGARGMWLAWSLADDAAVDRHPAGTAIRLYFHR